MFEETEEPLTLHGLGFLQLKLGGKQRLHIWHPKLPRRSCFEHSCIHDHRFSFVSRVLVGSLTNVLYQARYARGSAVTTHVSYLHEGTRTQFGNRPWISDERLSVKEKYRDNVEAGREYTMAAYEYHSSHPGGDGRVATIMLKTSEYDKGAHSLCKVGVTPDADFDRKQWPEERLWEIAREVLRSVTGRA